jgi:hypothetical protein
MFRFGKSAQQERIDKLAFDNAAQALTIKAQATALAEEKKAHGETADAYTREITRSNRLSGRLMKAHSALSEIRRMLTPGAAYAARRMAARAAEALPPEMGGPDRSFCAAPVVEVQIQPSPNP